MAAQQPSVYFQYRYIPFSLLLPDIFADTILLNMESQGCLLHTTSTFVSLCLLDKFQIIVEIYSHIRNI